MYLFQHFLKFLFTLLCYELKSSKGNAVCYQKMVCSKRAFFAKRYALNEVVFFR